MRRSLFITWCMVLASAVSAQDAAGVLQQKARDAGLSPAQTEAAVAVYGRMSPDEARRTAEEYGVDLDAADMNGALLNESIPAEWVEGVDAPDMEEDVLPKDTDKDAEEAVTQGMPRLPGIRPFGYDVFNLSRITFEPPQNATVPDDYLVGPGDELIITVWGETQLYHAVSVQRNGTVTLPNAGQVSVNGQTLEELRTTLLRRMSRYYASLAYGRSGARSYLDVTFGKLKSIRVYVLGEVKTPGGYVLSSMATVFTALYRAGGPTLDGSLRDITVRRGDSLVSRVDMYDYLVRGDNNDDIRLENGDVIMVKPVGITVTLKGEVFRPARYELREDETLADLVEYAGGYRHTAYLDRVSIRRIVPFAERDDHENDIIFMDVAAADAGGTELRDGDAVNVHRIPGMYENYVRITGAVAMPGDYALLPEMRVSDLVRRADGVLGDAFLKKGRIVRTRTDMTHELVPFDVKRALDAAESGNPVLQNLDEVHIYSENEFRSGEYISIDGAVRRPGVYRLLDSTTVADLVLKAGGFKDKVSPVKDIEVYRMDDEELYRFSREFSVKGVSSIRDVEGIGSFYLHKYDRIFVRENPAFELQKTVQINGEVTYPGVYPIENNRVRISDVINKAGGLKQDAFVDGFVFRREEKIVYIDLVDILDRMDREKKSKYDVFLRGGDELFIPKNPHTIRVTGEVMTPAIVLFQKGKGVRYYLEQAGGFTENADKKRMQVQLANGRMWKARCLLPDPPLTPGTKIYVPTETPTESKFWDTTKNIASIIGSIATTALVIDRIIRDK